MHSLLNAAVVMFADTLDDPKTATTCHELLELGLDQSDELFIRAYRCLDEGARFIFLIPKSQWDQTMMRVVGSLAYSHCIGLCYIASYGLEPPKVLELIDKWAPELYRVFPKVWWTVWID